MAVASEAAGRFGGRLALLDSLLPKGLRSAAPAIRWRVRLITLGGVLAAPGGAVFTGIAMATGLPNLAVVVAANVAVLALAPALLHLGRSPAVAGNLQILALFTLVLFGAATNGGLGAPAIVWLPCFPIGGYLLAGRVWGPMWAGASISALLLFYAVAPEGLVTLPGGDVSAFNPISRTFNLVAILVAATFFTRYALRDRERALEEMTRARDAADRASRAKSRFLASISHEIRTPLNGTLGAAELLLANELSAEQRVRVEAIHTSGRALEVLLEDVLDFSLIESGDVTIDESDFDPRELTRDLSDALGEIARSKGLELRVRVRPEVPAQLRSDPRRVRRILVNLVENAIKFTDAGGVDLDVSLARDGRALRFDVRDTGIGIESERIEAMFERFTQADASTTRRHGGAGLGLTIARRLCELIGAELEARSEPGRGSHFWLIVPVAEPSAPQAAARREAPASSARILFAEDNLVNQQVVVALLEQLGHHVDVVADGRHALEALEGVDYDLVFMDCHMPTLDGYEATRELRRREEARTGSERRLPVIALTASATAGERERCLDAGMDDYLTKPVTTRGLGATLLAWLPESTPLLPAGEADAAGGSLLDAGVLAELRSLDPGGTNGLIADLAKSYAETAPALLNDMLGALDAADSPGVARAAHTLKSSSGALGALGMAELCRVIESAAWDGALDDVETRLAEIQRLLPELVAEIARQGAAARTSGKGNPDATPSPGRPDAR